MLHSDAPKTKKEQVYEVFKELIMLVETPEMRKRTLNIFFSWLIVAMVYYGLSFNSKNIGGNRYVASFASGFVEVTFILRRVYLNLGIALPFYHLQELCYFKQKIFFWLWTHLKEKYRPHLILSFMDALKIDSYLNYRMKN